MEEDEVVFDTKTINLANNAFNELDSNFNNTEEYHYLETHDFFHSTFDLTKEESIDQEILETVENFSLAIYDCKYIYIF